MTLARDDAAIQEAADKFVTAYNDLTSALDTLYEGDLDRGPITTPLPQQSLLNVLNATPITSGPYSSISQVGVTRDKFGVLSLDASALTDALNTDMDAVAALFGDTTNGVAVRMEAFCR